MKLKRWIRIIIFVLLMAAILLFASTFLCVANEKDAVGVYGFFLEPEDSVDVVLIGPSFLYAGFYSPLAYEQQGFTSYAISTSTMKGSLYKYAAELAIETQHPQLLVFEVYGFCYEDQLDETSLRKFLDALPNSKIRNQAIADLVPAEQQESYYIRFERYHTSWPRVSNLAKVFSDKLQMRSQGYSITKNYGTTPFRQQYFVKESDESVTEEGFKYLQILLDYLQEADIENVLFFRCPSMVEAHGDESFAQMTAMIEEAGFDFIDLYKEDAVGIDVTHDYYNTTHLNVYGAERFTTYLSDYIMTHYQLETEHDPKVTKEWEECASYNDELLSYLKELTDQDVNGFLYTQKDFLEGMEESA